VLLPIRHRCPAGAVIFGDNMVYRLVYTSKAISSVTDKDLEDILSKARANNSRLKLTGLLMFHNSEFFQVLEGRKASVEALFKEISDDPRHITVKRLDAREVEARLFGDWSMAYAPISPDDEGQLLGEGSFFHHFVPDGTSDEHTDRLTRFITKTAAKMIAARS